MEDRKFKEVKAWDRAGEEIEQTRAGPLLVRQIIRQACEDHVKSTAATLMLLARENHKLRDVLASLSNTCNCDRPAIEWADGRRHQPGPHTKDCVSTRAAAALNTPDPQVIDVLDARKFVSKWLWESETRRTVGRSWDLDYINDAASMIAAFHK